MPELELPDMREMEIRARAADISAYHRAQFDKHGPDDVVALVEELERIVSDAEREVEDARVLATSEIEVKQERIEELERELNDKNAECKLAQQEVTELTEELSSTLRKLDAALQEARSRKPQPAERRPLAKARRPRVEDPTMLIDFSQVRRGDGAPATESDAPGASQACPSDDGLVMDGLSASWRTVGEVRKALSVAGHEVSDKALSKALMRLCVEGKAHRKGERRATRYSLQAEP
jgi:hypothetical protein